VGWSFCDGSILSISGNETLFTVIGTAYGGDGQSTFALPDLRGRVPLHVGTQGGITYVLAESGGVEQVTLTPGTTPLHAHSLMASGTTATLSNPNNMVTGAAANKLYRVPAATVQLSASTLGATGGSQPHENVQPFVAVSYIIALSGVFPTS
jgi:microcystin-dependent protein